MRERALVRLTQMTVPTIFLPPQFKGTSLSRLAAYGKGGETRTHHQDFCRPRLAFMCFAVLVTGGLAVAAYIVPLNANDLLKHLFRFEARTLSHTLWLDFIRQTPVAAAWRPLQLSIGHALYIVGEGREHLVFKGTLALSVVAMMWMIVRLLAVQTWVDAAAAVVAIFILIGHHSFAAAVEGVYPFGVEIILVICQLAILLILLRERAIGTDAAAFAISLFALLLNEKGGIVGATYIAGSALRMPGGSLTGAGAVFAGYLAVLTYRFLWVLSLTSFMRHREVTDAPTTLFDTLAPALNVLISDPRYGQFRTIPQALGGEPWAVVTVVSSVLTLAIIIAWAARSRETEIKVLALLALGLVASCMFGPFSRKDYIPIIALPFYALVSFYALRWTFTAHWRIAVALAAVLALTWGIRFAGLGYFLAVQAYNYQEEWGEAERYGEAHEHDPAITVPVIARMRAEAMARPLRYPQEVLPFAVVRLLRGRGCPELCN